MNDKEEESQSNDHDPTIISTEDQEIEERKPQNDKIVYFKIANDNNNSSSKEN